jgi:hypothetical protein
MDYKQPSRINPVTVGLVLVLLAGGYWMWRFFPAWFDAWTVDHILKESAAAVYRLNSMREPGRTEALTELVNKTRASIIEKASVTDPYLHVNLDIQDEKALLSADYHVTITHPLIAHTTELHFSRREHADIKKVNWSE